MGGFITASARNAALAGVAIAALVLAIWIVRSPIDTLGLVSFITRWLHILAAVIWVGMIWFVNFIQLAALEEADDAGRATLMRLVVPKVAATFRHASHMTLVSGFILLVTTGYLLDRWVFASAVYIPPLKAAMLWTGTLAALVMWALVHMVIAPALRIVAPESAANAEVRAAARARIKTSARINLMLALPVTFVMVAAAHLY